MFSSYSLSILLGCLGIGLCSGLMGVFLVSRRMSLMGDVLGHAVLPGIVLSFIFASYQKIGVAIFLGALASAYLAHLTFEFLSERQGIRRDAAMAIVLTGFYSLGTALLSFVQNHAGASQAGLDRYLLGQAAAMTQGDFIGIALVLLTTLLSCFLFFKEFRALCFDPEYLKSSGLHDQRLKALLGVLIAATVVVNLQATGVILASALLIIPASTATFFSRSFEQRLLISALLGGTAAFLGAAISAGIARTPTGPSIILVGISLFLFAWLFAPRSGFIARKIAAQRRQRQDLDENLLKTIYYWNEIENNLKAATWIRLPLIISRLAVDDVARLPQTIERARELSLIEEGQDEAGNPALRLREEGMRVGADVVRRHRLWELYLMKRLDFKIEWVHDEAERAEHFIDQRIIQEIEVSLGNPRIDPHGRVIPSVQDLRAHEVPGY